VVENGKKSNPMGWIIGLIVLLLLVLIFFGTNGFGLFNGTAANDGAETINVDTPDNVNVQPSSPTQ
jgi:hypothetical protein